MNGQANSIIGLPEHTRRHFVVSQYIVAQCALLSVSN